jgi:hypothetical protein
MGSKRLLLFVFGVLKLPAGKMFGYFECPVQHFRSRPAKTDNFSNSHPG